MSSIWVPILLVGALLTHFHKTEFFQYANYLLRLENRIFTHLIDNYHLCPYKFGFKRGFTIFKQHLYDFA